MPYNKDRKSRTHHKILESAHRLFSTNGFEATSIEEIMLECDLTRGGFYTHFQSKGQLYQEAMGREFLWAKSAGSTSRKNLEPCIDAMLASCLHPLDTGKRSETPWSFLATDLASKQPEVRLAYTKTFTALSQQLQHELNQGADDDHSSLAAMAMVVGALAVVMTVDETLLKESLVKACREHARRLLDAGGKEERLNFFWGTESLESKNSVPVAGFVH